MRENLLEVLTDSRLVFKYFDNNGVFLINVNKLTKIAKTELVTN